MATVGKAIVEFVIHQRTGRLLATFLIFVALQLMFGALYYWLSRRRWDYFSFNYDVLTTQRNSIERLTERNLLRLRAASEVVAELTTELNRGVEPYKFSGYCEVALPSGNKCTMKFFANSAPVSGAVVTYSFFEIADPTGKILFYREVPRLTKRTVEWRQHRAGWLEALPKFSVRIQRDLRANQLRRASLTTPMPDVWSYWDFFYFSTIVQTTVGFGDILPNSTMVRMIVAIQIIVGYALLIVVLNIVLG